MTAQPRWPKGTTPELEKYAFELLGETPELKKKALADLRLLIQGHEGLDPRTDDIFLLRFLRAKKYDVDKAARALVTYYKFLEKQSHLFARRLPSELKKTMDMNFTLLDPRLLPGGSMLTVTLVGNFDVKCGTQQDMVSTHIAIGELLLDHEATQIVGCTRVIDFKNLTAQHYMQFITPSFMSLCLGMFQDVWPERFKAVHVVNESFFMHALAKLIFPLLKKKIRERFHFHGDDLESLHKHVPKEYLPEELGGSMGPFDCKEFAEYLYSHEDFFKKSNTFGLIKMT